MMRKFSAFYTTSLFLVCVIFITSAKANGPGLYPTGIEDQNIVGYYATLAQVRHDPLGGDEIMCGPTHSFFYDGTTWKTLDMPGAKETYARGISGNYIVGNCHFGTGKFLRFDGKSVEIMGPAKGFIYDIDKKTWTTLYMPGAANTTPRGISGNYIVGDWQAGTGEFKTFSGKQIETMGPTKGFIYDIDKKTWTTMKIDIPDADPAAETRFNGICDKNILGIYGAYDKREYQFIYDISRKIFTKIDISSGAAIDGNNIIGGKYLPSDPSPKYSHGFIYNIEKKTCTIIDMPKK